MKRRLIASVFVLGAMGSAGVSARDSVLQMYGSDVMADLTWSVIGACTDLATYPADNDATRAGNQPIFYKGKGSTLGENEIKRGVFAGQLVAPMTLPLGKATCRSDYSGAEGIVFGLSSLDVVFGPGAGAEGIDYSGAAGDLSDGTWRKVLREVYTGMGASGANLFARDCNSASRHAIVDNWDNLFHGSTGSMCSDSNPDAATTEPGLRHAFRRDEEAGATNVFLVQLGLSPVDFMQGLSAEGAGPTVVPLGSNSTQAVNYMALASSPFCNVRRPGDKNAPVSKGGSFIPPMYQIGLPMGAGGPTLVGSQGLVPYDPSAGDSSRLLAPYMPEMQDQDPIRRKCFGSKQSIVDSPNGRREEVCSADGALGLVLPISSPAGSTASERYPTLPCDETRDFEFAPAPTRPNGDTVRCPNGDAPLDGKCLTPTRTEGAGFAFDCLNNGLNAPAAIFDSDGNGSDFPDAPTTDGRSDADGRAYNLIARKANGDVIKVDRPNPIAAGTMVMPMVGAYYRLHSSRSGLPAPDTLRTCTESSSDSQIACLVQLNLCSMGLASGAAVANHPGTVATPVHGIAPSTTTVQALVSGGTVYPFAHKLYLNTLTGFEALLTSSDPAPPTGKDAERDLAECFANLPFSTFGSVGAAQLNIASSGFIPLPAPAGGGSAKAFCEDFNANILCEDASHADSCANNTGLIPASACNNGYKDGNEVGVDVCPPARPSCNSTTHHCQ